MAPKRGGASKPRPEPNFTEKQGSRLTCNATSRSFGRFAAERRAEKGLELPETFRFLGFKRICSTRRDGAFQLKRFTRRDRMRLRLRLQSIRKQLHKRKHDPIAEQGRWLGQMVRGYFAYDAVPTDAAALAAFRFQVMRHWRHALSWRNQRHHITWDWMNHLPGVRRTLVS
jgi:RNA-directed DNA polymerase